MPKRFYIYMILAIAFALMGIVSVLADHFWGSPAYHWARESTLTLEIGNNLSGDWTGYYNEAIGDWNASPYINLIPTAGQARGKCRPNAGRAEVCNDAYGNNGWLGLAQIWLSDGHVVQGVAKMNDTYFAAGTYNTPAWKDVVMCQEIGHLFGLAHNDEDFSTTTGTCMDYSSNPEPNRQPNAHDFDAIASIYSHSDGDGGDDGGGGDTPCRGGPKQCPNGFSNGVPSGDFNHPSEWGQLVSSHRGHAIYVRNFGNVVMITDVIWADGFSG